MVAFASGHHLHLQLLQNRGAKPAFSQYNSPKWHFSTNCADSRWHGFFITANSRAIQCPAVQGIGGRSGNRRAIQCQAVQGVGRRSENRYKGYQRIGRRFSANIGHEGRAIFLGSYDTEEEAARVHDEARIFKDKNPRNFPVSDYPVDHIQQGFADFETFVQHKRMLAGKQNNTKRSPGKTSRYKGVGRTHRQWRACINRGGAPVSFGCYYKEEDAAKAYDRACIFEEGTPVNFPDLVYDKADILKFSTIEDLAKASKEFARQLAKNHKKHRFEGVVPITGKFATRYRFSGEESLTRLGTFHSEDEAARTYDSACVFEGKAPVNFPEGKYDAKAIRQHTHQTFVDFCRHLALKPTKSTQHSRFTGVGKGPHRKFVASLYIAKKKKKHLGSFASEEEAARAVDAARILHGKEPVNYIQL